jgi:hypothetical protein
MASIFEMNSFVGKFLNLWQSGRDATLQVETQTGQACVTLRLGLGEHPGQQHRKKASPSRQRRLDRRATARQVSAETVEPNANTENDEDGSKEEIRIGKEATVKEAETVPTAVDEVSTLEANFKVFDEVCSNQAYENVDAKKNVDDVSELSEATGKGGTVEANSGEILIEVRPQYCVFSDKELANKLTMHVGFKLLCLPWIANTGKHFYTAGFKTSEDSYEKFKSKGNGSLPKGFYRVSSSRKLN